MKSVMWVCMGMYSNVTESVYLVFRTCAFVAINREGVLMGEGYLF